MTTTRTTHPQRMETERRLLLFDIDGTLITSGGAGEGALMDAMKERFGVDSLSIALLGVAVVFSLWSALHFFLAARTLKDDIATS